jgi:hypothetical protein
MKKLLIGLATLPFLAGVALAGQPTPLADNQMDKVTAGFDFAELDINNVGTVAILINNPAVGGCALAGGCFVNIEGTPWGNGLRSFQLQAAFGGGGLAPPPAP